MHRASIPAVAAALLFAFGPPAAAQDAPASVEELWEIVQRQQAEIDALKQQLGATREEVAEASEKVTATEAQLEATGDYLESFEGGNAGALAGLSLGGYGELHYNNLDADDPAEDLERIDFHRFVLFLGHEFSERIHFFSELEIEHSLAGDGAPGEVELEQAYVNFALDDTTSAQAGLFLLPLGILNETHEPTTFYGVERNDVESVIIPSTWWEAGAALKGQSGNGLSWDVALHSGLAIPTTGGDAFRVRDGRQKVAEALASDPAITGRLKYTGFPGLELAASYQYQSDPSQVGADGLDTGHLFTAHAAYQAGAFGLRALYGSWRFNGPAVEAAGADEQDGWYVEPSYRLNEQFGVYARYEDLEGASASDRFSQYEAGLNYWPVPGVVLKMDVRSRDFDTLPGRDFDGFDLGVGYAF
ncbi:MAG TPA: porin [Woeseiaceae bacterium]|nr:porin [Woeseiaceae bacterium]